MPTGRWLLGVGLAFAIGFLVLPTLGHFVSGDLPSLALVGVAAFVSVLVRPGVPGLVANAAGLTAYITILYGAAGFSGLYYLGLTFMLPAVATGAACATIVNRVRAVGLSEALLDRRLWISAAVAAILQGGLVWFYISVVTSDSPP